MNDKIIIERKNEDELSIEMKGNEITLSLMIASALSELADMCKKDEQDFSRDDAIEGISNFAKQDEKERKILFALNDVFSCLFNANEIEFKKGTKEDERY